MTTLRVTVLASLFFLVSACAPSGPPPTAVLTWDAQALATQIAASIFATQTASVPTASNTPDATEIPTATPQPTDTSTTLPSVSATAAPCVPTDQDQYVYHTYRLQVLQPCLRVSGVLDAIRSEQDGDRHILLHVDPAFQYLLRPSNQGEELGDLVIEPICVSVPTQADAIAPCSLDLILFGVRFPRRVSTFGSRDGMSLTTITVIGVSYIPFIGGAWLALGQRLFQPR